MADGPRLGDAERDALAQLLGRHYAEGRLDADELSRRLDVIYAATDHGGAAGALGDLPPLAPATPPPRRWWGRRHAEADRPEPTWLPTTERFVDPSTNRVMRVWLEPGGGARHYVPDG